MQCVSGISEWQCVNQEYERQFYLTMMQKFIANQATEIKVDSLELNIKIIRKMKTCSSGLNKLNLLSRMCSDCDPLCLQWIVNISLYTLY